MRVYIKHFDNSNWIICPKCGGRLFQTYHDTRAENLPTWCRRCKTCNTLKRITWDGGRQVAEFYEG